MKVIKRDGNTVDYNLTKIKKAISNAVISSVKDVEEEVVDKIATTVALTVDSMISFKDSVSVEEIQDIVENALIKYESSMSDSFDMSKEYIRYRHKRNNIRDRKNDIFEILHEIIHKSSSDSNLKRDNGNINGDGAMGIMLQIAANISKYYYLSMVIDKDIRELYNNGYIHIHDLDFYCLTETCCQIDIGKLLKDGFSTGHGFIRPPKDIMTATALVAIIIQSNQNDQHGGQSIPALDYGLAPYVAMSFKKIFLNNLYLSIAYNLDMDEESEQMQRLNEVIEYIKENIDISMTLTGGWLRKIAEKIMPILNIKPVDEHLMYDNEVRKVEVRLQNKVYMSALKMTNRTVYQAMEGLIHNLNTLHSRSGAQVPFSSLNYGTCTTLEGRMVIENILLAQEAGLGNGETPIFPISIFKLKSGVSYNKEDPNYDLFKLAVRVSAKRLFPNFSNLDAPFNLQYYKENSPETEVAYMGCRTRVIGNVYSKDNETVFGRGNLSFTTINLPLIALDLQQSDVCYDNPLEQLKLNIKEYIDICAKQLLDRLKIQGKRKVKNHPFLMGQGLWMDSDKLTYDDELAEVLKHGSLSVGFCGLAECMVAIYGKHHGEDDDIAKKAYSVIEYMRSYLDELAEIYKLNFTLLATPAESVAGRFALINRKKYGIIEGVTDNDFITNSFHVPVYHEISITKKIDIEAPYHALCNAGHISYIELDGDPTTNLPAFEKIIRYMHDKGMGYMSINHPVDRDPVCGYTGVIKDVCPRCGRTECDDIDMDKLFELAKIYPEASVSYNKFLKQLTNKQCKGE